MDSKRELSRSPSRSRSRSPRRRRSPPPHGSREYSSYPPPSHDHYGGGGRDYYDRGYDRSYDRGYDRRDYYVGGRDYYDRGYDRGYDRSYPPRGPPPRPKRYEVVKGDEADRNTSKCLYVGNIPYSFREEDVTEMFEKCGRLASVSVPIDRYTGRNKGFAFLAFEERRDAEDAKEKYDSYPVEGRRLRIDWDVGRDKKEIVKGGPVPRAPLEEAVGGPPPRDYYPKEGGGYRDREPRY